MSNFKKWLHNYTKRTSQQVDPVLRRQLYAAYGAGNRFDERDIHIYGAGGFAIDVAMIIERAGIYNVCGFIDDTKESLDVYQGLPVYPSVCDVYGPIAIGIGSPAARERVAGKCYAYKTPTVVDPSVVIGSDVSMGKGCAIHAGVIVVNRCEIEDFVILNLATTLGHGAHVGSYSNLSPGVKISGDCYIGMGVSIYSGAIVAEKVRIGDRSVVAAGAVVLEDVPANVMVAGVPAKVKRAIV